MKGQKKVLEIHFFVYPKKRKRKMERVLEIAKQGNGYLAVEKSMAVIRLLKKQKKIDDAMIFMMNLAHTLADVNQWQPATVAALRSIELFPSDATTIKVVLKNDFVNFVKRANSPDAATTDFFKFIDKLTAIIGDPNNEFVMKKIEISILAKQNSNIQEFVYKAVLTASYAEEQTFDVAGYIHKAMVATWDWILSIPEEERIFSGQFIAGRYLLTFMTIHEGGIELYDQSLQILKETKPSQISDDFFNQPLFNMLNFAKKACVQNNKPALQMVIEKYNPLLVHDPELRKWLDILSSKFEQEAPQMPNLFQMFGNLFGGRPSEPPAENPSNQPSTADLD